MSRRQRVKRNNPCPCLSGKKFKNCCEGKVDWNHIFKETPEGAKDYLSIRGRNILFLERILEALKLDREPRRKSLLEYKAAFTREAVKKINEAILDIWPSDTEINSVLESARTEVSGLYIGEYRTELLIRGVTRHSLYANKILLVDPFVYPLSVGDQYNPILHPDQHRTQTLRNVEMWFHLAPWIHEGIVEFVRTPADFDPRLNWESHRRQEQKFKNNEELKALLEETARNKTEELDQHEALRMLILSAPDAYLRNVFKQLNVGTIDVDEDAFIKHIQKLREADPYYLEPIDEEGKGWSELFYISTGASYEIAKLTSNLTDSYLVTDIPTKWKEIELDRVGNGIGQSDEWSPLAKSFQNLDIKYLDNVGLDHALSLRKEERLQTLRAFLKRIWSMASSGNPYGKENVRHLADELESNVREAEYEWKQINRDLIKWLGAEAATGLLAGGPLIASGHAGFLAAAFATAGTATLVARSLQRKGFPDKYPAAFFMHLKKKGR